MKIILNEEELRENWTIKAVITLHCLQKFYIYHKIGQPDISVKEFLQKFCEEAQSFLLEIDDNMIKEQTSDHVTIYDIDDDIYNILNQNLGEMEEDIIQLTREGIDR